MILQLLLFLFVVCLCIELAYLWYQFATKGRVTSFNPLNFFKAVVKIKESRSETKVPDGLNKAKCTFLYSDIADGHVYTKAGTSVVDEKKEVECNSCKEYIYKADDGCSPYMYDNLYAFNNKGVCTAVGFGYPCTF